MESFGQMINVAKSSIASYEAENRQPSFEKLKKMAEVFNVSTDYLIGLTDDPDPKKSFRNVREFLDKEGLHYDGEKLSEKELEVLRGLVELLFKRKEEEA